MQIIKKLVLFTLLSGFVISLNAQNNGSINHDVLVKIHEMQKNYPSKKAITNALSANNLENLVLNRSSVGKVDHLFNHKVNVKGITNQKGSGRCWMFTGLNVIRPKVIEKYRLNNFEFSTNYLFFWDQFEKANLFLEGIIQSADQAMDDKLVEFLFRSPVADGGVWNSFTNLVGKYGLMPKSAMPETNSSESTGSMRRYLVLKLREHGLELRQMIADGKSDQKVQSRKIEMLADVYHILAINLGEPPHSFVWRYKDKDGKISEYKEYTPMSFYKEIMDFDADDYVLFMDDPTREYYKLYEIEYDRNVLEGRNWVYINLPADKIKEYARKSILANEAMYFSCDVGKQLNRNEGLLSVDNYDYESLLGVPFGMNKKERILTKSSGSSHGMALVGFDDASGKIDKWLLENSWGPSSGHKGYLTMTDEWFDEYMFRVVVLKKFVDEETLKILESEAILLPPWDPMFSADN